MKLGGFIKTPSYQPERVHQQMTSPSASRYRDALHGNGTAGGGEEWLITQVAAIPAPSHAPVDDVRVEDVMSRQVVRIRQDADLFHAAEIVATTGVADLTVVDDDGRLAGALGVGDILRAAMPDLAEITAESGTVEAAFRLFIRKGRALAGLPIAPLVIRQALVARDDDHVAKVAALLLDAYIDRVPVLDAEDRLVGTISRADIYWALAGAQR
jgi:CBS domain-containing protein